MLHMSMQQVEDRHHKYNSQLAKLIIDHLDAITHPFDRMIVWMTNKEPQIKIDSFPSDDWGIWHGAIIINHYNKDQEKDQIFTFRVTEEHVAQLIGVTATLLTKRLSGTLFIGIDTNIGDKGLVIRHPKDSLMNFFQKAIKQNEMSNTLERMASVPTDMKSPDTIVVEVTEEELQLLASENGNTIAKRLLELKDDRIIAEKFTISMTFKWTGEIWACLTKVIEFHEDPPQANACGYISTEVPEGTDNWFHQSELTSIVGCGRVCTARRSNREIKIIWKVESSE